MAEALATATPEQIREINRAHGQISKAAGDVGDGFAKGIEAQISKVDKAGRRLAHALIDAFRAELGGGSGGGKGKGKGHGGKGGKGGKAHKAGKDHVRALAAGIRDGGRDAEKAAAHVAGKVAAASSPTYASGRRQATAATRVSASTVRTAEVLTIRHEVVSPDGSVSKLTANQLADLIARDPRSASRIEAALLRTRRRRQSNALNPSR